jgi:hypothetical protein
MTSVTVLNLKERTLFIFYSLESEFVCWLLMRHISRPIFSLIVSLILSIFIGLFNSEAHHMDMFTGFAISLYPHHHRNTRSDNSFITSRLWLEQQTNGSIWAKTRHAFVDFRITIHTVKCCKMFGSFCNVMKCNVIMALSSLSLEPQNHEICEVYKLMTCNLFIQIKR